LALGSHAAAEATLKGMMPPSEREMEPRSREPMRAAEGGISDIALLFPLPPSQARQTFLPLPVPSPIKEQHPYSSEVDRAAAAEDEGGRRRKKGGRPASTSHRTPQEREVSSWTTLRARWVTLRARWVTLSARCVTLRLAG
jgi:hypothetical protein